MVETKALARNDNGQGMVAASVSPATMELVLQGDLSKLSAQQRCEYYLARCDAAGLDPRTRPFDYLTLNGKLTLYANATAAQQAAEKRRLSLSIVDRSRLEDIYVVTCRVTDPGGRYTESIGAVPLASLRGDALANALMKCETKAKRRAVLSFCGLGMLDESELETVAGARVVPVNPETGEIMETRSNVAERVAAATEQAPNYAAATVSRPNGEIGFVKQAVAQQLASLGYPEPAKPKPYFEAILGAKIGSLKDLDLDQWQQLAGALETANRDRKRALSAYSKWCLKEGHDPKDRDLRLQVFSDFAGVPRLDTSGRLTPGEWRTVADALQAAAGDAAEPEAEIVTETDPFRNE